MEPANLTKLSQAPANLIGELVLQNGRQAGTRRPLAVPTTFVGRGQGCDVRLNVDGVDSMHCVLVHSGDGIVVRDMNSSKGTFVNGERITSTPIRHGDMLKVGPFQFRIELTAAEGAKPGDKPENIREALHIQVAAVAAQQAALEEEETRLLQRQSDLHLQEQQLATHLAEKQEQIEAWSEQTEAERDELRRRKTEQQALLTQWENELNAVKEELGQEQQRLILERQRIHKVYQRLRQRWQRQWSMARQKNQELSAQLDAETKALEKRQDAARAQETNFAHEVRRFNTERELTLRQQHESWEELKKVQATWKRRFANERALAKARQQQIDAATAKMHEARSLLEQERDAWEKQQDLLHKELRGLNNRVVHQRQAVKEQEDKLAALDQQLRERLLQLKSVSEIEARATPPSDGAAAAETRSTIACIRTEETAPPRLSGEERTRTEALNQLAGDLADQRVHLLEQYKRLAEIQEAWLREREQAAQELETAAQNLADKEDTLGQREQDTAHGEHRLAQERAEVRTLRQEIHMWRARLKEREQAVQAELQKGLLTVRHQEMLVQDQLATLTQLRQRWNRRRQEEIEQLRGEQTRLHKERQDLSRLREELFEKGKHVEEEKRILAEKSLAVELYRQETLGRDKDPVAERRIERLRRRWLTQNAGQVRQAKQEHEAVATENAGLQNRIDQWGTQMEKLAQLSAVLAEQQTTLEERDGLLRVRAKQVEQEIARSEAQRKLAEENYARLKEEMESFAKAVYEEAELPAPSQGKAA